MNVKSSTLNASSAYYFSGNHRLIQKNFLLLIAASASLAFFGMQICCDKNATNSHPSNCNVEQNFTQNTESGKWTYDEMAHKLIFEYGGKSREVEGFSYRLGNALLKVTDKINAGRGV
ncbi:hypothetical protein [Dyadobacter pollutisoli]|jgi:hypothetical protein|uniref:Uncharacterized protein n=1 Tax=Dyadobacter pollutisoli TaxID=2910158 RepID=A0A9E8SNZ0_9BACT|nr:hypothetical protein [Dyadobacter pollutisoli]WAC14191.1 hypothetical protein ON006_09575 [Dyadobacter pollutisoli]